MLPFIYVPIIHNLCILILNNTIQWIPHFYCYSQDTTIQYMCMYRYSEEIWGSVNTHISVLSRYKTSIHEEKRIRSWMSWLSLSLLVIISRVQFGKQNTHKWVFQRPQNSTSPKIECYLWPLKNPRVCVNISPQTNFGSRLPEISEKLGKYAYCHMFIK